MEDRHTRFELARIIGARALQISFGAPSLVKPKKEMTPIEIAKEDVFDPRLHTKPLDFPLKGKFSFRITRDWRVGFEFLGPRIIHLLAVDHRSRIYRRIGR